MDPQLQQALARVLDEMIKAAEAIGIQGVRLWPQLVGITFITNLAWSVVIPVLWIVSAVFLWHGGRMARAWDVSQPPHSEGKGFGTFIAFVCPIMWAVFLVATFGAFAAHAAGAAYPEAATVLDLLSRAGAAAKK